MATKTEFAAFCAPCEIVFEAADRDLLLDELYCPYCSCRTEQTDRGASIDELRARFPDARVYTLPRLPAVLEMAVSLGAY